MNEKGNTMNTKKIIAATIIAAAGTFGVFGMADAATGVVNTNAVLAASSDFKNAQQAVREERASLQKSFADKAKNLDDAGKQALYKEYSQQLVKKEQSVFKPIHDKFVAAVEKAAKAKNVDTVVDAGGLYYGKADVDLTEDVKANMK